MVGFLGQAGEVAVGVVLVAVLNQQIAGRFPDAHPDDVLPVLLELDDQRGESLSPESRMKVPISGRVNTSSVASTARRMSVAFFLLVPNAGRRSGRSTIGQRHDVLRVAAPVGIGPLDRHLALDDVAVEQGPELLGQVAPNAQGDVVEVDQEGRVRCVGDVHARGVRDGRLGGLSAALWFG